MQVAKWGNSLAIRIPAAVVKVLDLKEGDQVEIAIGAGGVLKIDHAPCRAEMWQRIDRFVGKLPADWKFDREEANAR